jgi:hypothetical protein
MMVFLDGGKGEGIRGKRMGMGMVYSTLFECVLEGH